MRLALTAVRIISFSALLLAILASAALAEELSDARMDQITGGGLFELTADQLDSATNAPQRNVIGGVGVMLEQFLSETFRSRQALLRDLGSTSGTTLRSGNTNMPLGNTNMPLGNTNMPLGNTNITLGNTNITLGNTNITLGNTNIALGNTNITGLPRSMLK